MAELDKFLGEENTDLDLFLEDDEFSTIQVNNEPSNKNMAAYAATLSDGEKVVDNYVKTKAELDTDSKSSTLDEVMKGIRDGMDYEAQQSYLELLSDPSVTEEDKNKVVDALVNGFDYPDVIETNSMLNLEEDSEEDSTNEHELVRIDTIDNIRGINEYNRNLQSIINGEMIKRDGNLLKQTKDFVEIALPYVEGLNAGQVLGELRKAEGREDTSSAIAKGIALLGSTKAEIRDTVAKMPPEARLELTQSLINIINEHDGVVLPDGNDFAAIDLLRAGLEAGYYTDADEWIDNFFSVLDMTVIGGVIARPLRGGGKAGGLFRGGKPSPDDGFDPYDIIRERHPGFRADMSEDDVRETVTKRMIESDVSPMSVAENQKKTNTAKARATHDLAMEDESGTVADAAYNASREDAAANDLLYKIPNSKGVVKFNPPKMDKVWNINNTPNARVMDFANSDGMIYFWKSEKRAMDARVTNDFKNAAGVTLRNELIVTERKGNGLNVKATYSLSDNGWRDPEEAIEAVKYALRGYGVDNGDITLLERTVGDFVPTTLIEAKAKVTARQALIEEGAPEVLQEIFPKPIEYIAQVNYDYKYNPADLTDWQDASVKYNVFDRIGAMPYLRDRVGSFQSHILDAASMMHPKTLQGATTAVSRSVGLEKALTDVAKDYGKVFSKLSKKEKEVLNDVIKEENAQSRNHKLFELRAMGLSDDAIEALNSWREAWDTIYWLENADLARTLRSKGYGLYVDSATDTRLFAKKIPKPTEPARVYDPKTDEIRTMLDSEVKELYDNGGYLAKTRGNMDTSDGATDIIAVKDTLDSYIRNLKDTDQILNYREGYYQVQYKDPRFIVERVTDVNGNFLYEKAVATAGNIKDADLMVKRMQSTTGGEFYHRADRNKDSHRLDSDDYWSLQSAAGRTAQRVRGKRLEDSTSPITAPGHEHILDPVTSLANSVRSVSRRVSIRNYMETVKTRFINQFEDLLPKDRFQQPRFPNNSGEISSKSGISSKKLADARTTYEYIRSLEDGYINHIDEGWKAMLNFVADTVGSAGMSKTEMASRAVGNISPASKAKNAAFTMYLVGAPIRQALVQSHQMVQLISNFPKEFSEMIPQMLLMAGKMRGIELPEKYIKTMTGMSKKDFDEMFTEFEKSGLRSAVDANNLVREDLKSIADITAVQKAYTGVKYPLTLAQKVGFDMGEQANVMSSWLVHRNKAVNDGKELTRSEYDRITGAAINYTYNMNAAGDMPYNRNIMNLPLQFIQVPHKATTQMFLNRGLKPVQKARLAAWNLVMYGMPFGTGALLYPIMPDEQQWKDFMNFGFMTVMYNKVASVLTGTNVRMDWSSLDPVDLHGMADTLSTIITDSDLMSVFSESPTGSLLFGANPRVTNAFKTSLRAFGIVEDYEEPTELSDVAKAHAQLFSGLSSVYKTLYALEYGQKMSSTGAITDRNVNTPEAIFGLFGIDTLDETYARKVKKTMYEEYEAGKSLDDDVKKWYKDMKIHFARKDISNEEFDFASRASAEVWRVWNKVDQQRARDILFREISKDAKRGDHQLVKQIFRRMGEWSDYKSLSEMIEEVPLQEGEEWKRKAMRETLQSIIEFEGE